jgi:hypothetical protein
MNDKLLNEFVKRYGITNISYAKEFSYNSRYDYAQTASGQLAYRNSNQQSVDIEIPMRGLEHMVDMDYKADAAYLVEYEDMRIRRNYPAVETAYSQYKMLLELYR